jgi:hypothetical protein
MIQNFSKRMEWADLHPECFEIAQARLTRIVHQPLPTFRKIKRKKTVQVSQVGQKTLLANHQSIPLKPNQGDPICSNGNNKKKTIRMN